MSIEKEWITSAVLRAVARSVEIYMLGSFLCGYVEIPVDHKLYGKQYDEINDYIEIHGGLTYSESRCPELENNNTWWFGFDCAHSGDGFIESDGNLKTLDYVIRECESLSEQLIKHKEKQ